MAASSAERRQLLHLERLAAQTRRPSPRQLRGSRSCRSSSRRRGSGRRSRHGLAPVDEAAGDRAAVVVRILGDRADEPAGGREAVLEARRPSKRSQPKFAGGRAGSRDEVDLLDRVLADVADLEVAVRAVEGEAPRVAQAERRDLATRAGWATSIRSSLPSAIADVLRAVLRVAAGAAVAHARRRACRRGPNWSWPPLWFAYGWSTKSSCARASRGRPAPRSRGTRPRSCRRSGRCSRRRSGGSSRSSGGTRAEQALLAAARRASRMSRKGSCACRPRRALILPRLLGDVEAAGSPARRGTATGESRVRDR